MGTEVNAPAANTNTEKPKAEGKKPKAEKPKAEKKPKAEIEKCLHTSHDPKNRVVHLHQKGDKYRVLKSATGFNSGWLNKKQATQAFEQQQASSQNQ
jgi:hypothetical protein